MKNYCSQICDSLFINSAGDVYPCCFERPGRLGNIWSQSLESMWNGEKRKEFRRVNSEGLLTCAANCELVSEKRTPGEQKHDTDDAVIKTLHIEFHDYCNIKCKFCYQREIKQRKSNKSTALVEQLRPFRIGKIMLQGGEPFILPDCLSFYKKTAVDQSIDTVLMTNGLLFNHTTIPLICDGSSKVIVSLNSCTSKTHERLNIGSDFRKVLSGVRTLYEACDGLMTIEAHMTIVPENLSEITIFPEFVLNECFNSVSYCLTDECRKHLSKNRPVAEKVADNILSSGILKNHSLRNDKQSINVFNRIMEFSRN